MISDLGKIIAVGKKCKSWHYQQSVGIVAKSVENVTQNDQIVENITHNDCIAAKIVTQNVRILAKNEVNRPYESKNDENEESGGEDYLGLFVEAAAVRGWGHPVDAGHVIWTSEAW